MNKIDQLEANQADFTGGELKNLINGEELLLKRAKQRYEEGDKKAALDMYKAVLIANPDNEEAKQKTAELEEKK